MRTKKCQGTRMLYSVICFGSFYIRSIPVVSSPNTANNMNGILSTQEKSWLVFFCLNGGLFLLPKHPIDICLGCFCKIARGMFLWWGVLTGDQNISNHWIFFVGFKDNAWRDTQEKERKKKMKREKKRKKQERMRKEKEAMIKRGFNVPPETRQRQKYRNRNTRQVHSKYTLNIVC